MINFYEKNSDEVITFGLTAKEYSCNCNDTSCRAVYVTDYLILAYNKFRRLVNVPLRINSGHRCAYHNYNVSGESESRHLTGEAIDICKRSLKHLSDEEIQFALKKSGFTFIIIYDTFVHADVRF